MKTETLTHKEVIARIDYIEREMERLSRSLRLLKNDLVDGLDTDPDAVLN